jgi:hypothetical protein
MTIPYTTGIPDSGHAPSADQPLMKVNNDNNFQIWGIDHYSFNDTTAPNGEHKAVTFPLTQSTPTLSTLQTQIYPQTFTGSSKNILETYAAAANSSGAQLNGYIPFVKAMGQYVTLVSSTGTLTANAHSININITSVVQSTTTTTGDTITIKFINDMPTNNYYIFLTGDTAIVGVTATKGLSNLVITNANFRFGIPLGFMVI